MESTCRLCCQTKPLRVSHIIPAFVWAWLKKTSVGGVRGSEIPNRRIQDGPKVPMLCEACEQTFSVWEREFCKNIFDPIHASARTPIGLPYRGTWALRFCVSVSWRALELLKDHGLSHLTEPQQRGCDETLETWRKFLTNALPHPGRHEQHLVPLDVIADHTMPDLSPFINRYLTRAIDLSLPTSNKEVLTYVKMGRLLLIGFAVPAQDTTDWKGTKVRVREGTVGDDRMVLPGKLYNWMNERANFVASKLGELSPPQKQKIERLSFYKPDEILESDVFRALTFDVQHSGQGAFTITQSADAPTEEDA